MKTSPVPCFDDDVSRVALDSARLIARRFGSHIANLSVVRPPEIIDADGMAMMVFYALPYPGRPRDQQT